MFALYTLISNLTSAPSSPGVLFCSWQGVQKEWHLYRLRWEMAEGGCREEAAGEDLWVHHFCSHGQGKPWLITDLCLSDRRGYLKEALIHRLLSDAQNEYFCLYSNLKPIYWLWPTFMPFHFNSRPLRSCPRSSSLNRLRVWSMAMRRWRRRLPKCWAITVCVLFLLLQLLLDLSKTAVPAKTLWLVVLAWIARICCYVIK